jgi:hypothetical protein
VRKTLIEGVRDYLIVSHLPVRDCVIVNNCRPPDMGNQLVVLLLQTTSRPLRWPWTRQRTSPARRVSSAKPPSPPP